MPKRLLPVAVLIAALAFLLGLESESEPMPDLRIDPEASAESVAITAEAFAEDSCAIEEACVLGPGERKLLRFDTVVQNVGDADWLIGDPEEYDGFEFAACHGHHHLSNVTLYELRTSDGLSVVTGRKQGFCLRDDSPVLGEALPVQGVGFGKFDCEYQGLTAGWSDVYGSELDCQWLDVTEVPEGDYILRLVANPELIFGERDYSNNVIHVPVRIE